MANMSTDPAIAFVDHYKQLAAELEQYKSAYESLKENCGDKTAEIIKLNDTIKSIHENHKIEVDGYMDQIADRDAIIARYVEKIENPTTVTESNNASPGGDGHPGRGHSDTSNSITRTNFPTQSEIVERLIWCEDHIKDVSMYIGCNNI